MNSDLESINSSDEECDQIEPKKRRLSVTNGTESERKRSRREESTDEVSRVWDWSYNVAHLDKEIPDAILNKKGKAMTDYY
jgi:hypothetical protein